MQAINIIAEEIGIAPAEMNNELEFADAGVDSLLSLTVCGRLREELNMDISSSLFMDCPTVRDLKRYLGATMGPTPVSSYDSSSDGTQGSGRSDQGEESDATSIDDNFDTKHGREMVIMESSSGETPLISALCSILADEVGVQVEEIWSAPSLSDLGVDSLMSLQVLGRLREELDLDLPTDIFFHDNMVTIREKLVGTSTQSPMQDTSISKTALDSTLRTSSSLVDIPAATSVVLQGSLKTAQKVLFLFPDGSGSATSYASLPRVAQGVAVVGMNCPYMKRPQDLKCSLADLTTPYLAEIRRRQPHGPYHLGGWSAGGICAYDAAKILIAGGEVVESLILLDSPNPIHLEKLPTRLYHFLSGVGVFGSGDPSKALPEWLLPHFLAFVDALALYEPDPFPPGRAPSTHAIWAADGVYRSTGGKRLEKQADDTRELRWLLEDRVDFGPNGWDKLVGVNKLKMQVLQGANHFTMFNGQQGQQLSRFIATSLGI
jgi:naphtho-gamma-pyrone polyketide synthase